MSPGKGGRGVSKTMSATRQTDDLEQTLRDRFGLNRFRPGQQEVIQAVLERRDVLCVMPTGGGKSLCYQLPALRLEGPTLVVSPLIALMKDQVDSLTERGVAATFINSTLDPEEQRARMLEIEAGRYDLVYVAPERFRSGRFLDLMSRVQPALLAVDEAHCISEWGHDFRPDYARLGQARRSLGMPPCIALTATATDLVRRDIADQLDLRDPSHFITGFDRPNLTYRVVEARRDAEKLSALAQALERNPGSAIVYASSRKRCEDVGRYLEEDLGRSVAIYHAGLSREERNSAQDRFMSGRAEIVVATNAFGMGVDKPDIRAVVHFNMPGTIEAYYQEAGRAGRDGLPSECVLLYSSGDRKLQEIFIENEYPPPDAIYKIYDFLRGLDADPIELTQHEIRDLTRLDLHESAVGTSLKLLESAGALERLHPRENMAIIRINAEPEDGSLADRLDPRATTQRGIVLGLEALVNERFGEAVYFHPDEFAAAIGQDRATLTRTLRTLIQDGKLPIDYIPPFRGNAVRIFDRNKKPREVSIDFRALNARKQQEFDKLDRMIDYSRSTTCRRSVILGYFGDSGSATCGQCDNCQRGSRQAGAPTTTTIDTPAGRVVLLKILSGVARTRGRFGKTVIAQMLVGSQSERMTRGGLSSLSTYGILERSGFTQREVCDLIDALTASGLVHSEEVDRGRPVVRLSDPGWAWVRGQDLSPPRLPLPDSLAEKLRNGGLERVVSESLSPAPSDSWTENGEAGSPTPDPGETDGTNPRDDPLWEELRALRLQLAREARLSPAYIFSNETLEALVRDRPTSPADLMRIKGIGPSKLERFGSSLLEVIQATKAREPETVEEPDAPLSEPSPALATAVVEPSLNQATHPADPATSTEPVPTEEWTWRLLDRGFLAWEAAAIRGLDPSTIIDQATTLARQGKSIPLAAFLPPETLARWNDLASQDDSAAPEEPDLDPALWALFLACRDHQG